MSHKTKWDFYIKGMRTLFNLKKSAIVFVINYFRKYIAYKDSLLRKVVRHHTFVVNKYFILTIGLSCFIAALFSYYEENSKYQQSLLTRNSAISDNINKIFEQYHTSLKSLGENLLWNDRYLYNHKDKISKVLMLSIGNNNLLFNTTWHPKNKPNKAFGMHGEVLSDNQLKANIYSYDAKSGLNIEEFINQQDQLIFIMTLPLINNKNNNNNIYKSLKNNNENSENSKNNKDSENTDNVVGYLKLPVSLITLLESLDKPIIDGEIIGLYDGVKPSPLFFIKKDGLLHPVDNKPEDNNIISFYKLSPSIKLAYLPYRIIVGSSNKFFLKSLLHTIYSRVFIIAALGCILMVIYNRLERRKITNLYNKTFINEVGSLQNKYNKLLVKQQVSSNKIQELQKLVDAYAHSIKVTNLLQQQLSQGLRSSFKMLTKTIVKLNNHYINDNDNGANRIDEMHPQIIKQLTGNIFNIIDNLLNNSFSNDIGFAAINLAEVLDKAIELFMPVTISKSILIKKRITISSSNSNIKCNELMIWQLIISLLNRSVYSVSKNGIITVSLKENVANKMVICIVDDGFVYDDQLLTNGVINYSNALPIGNFQLDIGGIKKIITDLGGSIIIGIGHQDNNQTILKGNKTLISLPIYSQEAEVSNIIPFKRQSNEIPY